VADSAAAGAPAQTMSLFMDDALWNLIFSVEVSTLYHDWRRAHLWQVVQWVKGVTLFGAIATLITALLHWGDTASLVIAAISIIIAIVSLADLVYRFSESAQLHEDLFKKFKLLQARIEGAGREVSGNQIAEWQGEAQLIRADEPPTLWAIYSQCWNQVIERHRLERSGYYRKVGFVKKLVGGVIAFNPQDFPPLNSPFTPRVS
jgi:hypothetical protein